MVSSVWEEALAAVPDAYIQRAYDRAAANWDWQDIRHPFTADAISQAYTILVVEDRQRAEAERRNARRHDPDTYKCWHCLDLGYQQVWIYMRRVCAWYSAVSACSCELAPLSQRNQYPLQPPRWIRNKLGQYVLRDDLENYGAPNASFESFIAPAEGGGDVGT